MNSFISQHYLRFVIVIAVIVILTEITVRDRDLETSFLRDRDRDPKTQSRSTLLTTMKVHFSSRQVTSSFDEDQFYLDESSSSRRESMKMKTFVN